MNNNGFNFGFKPIEEFTFDDCVFRIEQNRIDGVESDTELLERYTALLSQLQQKDDAMYRKATDKNSLEKYIASYPLDSNAKKYQLRHIAEAKKKISQIIEIEIRKRRKKRIVTLSLIAAIALVVCWINYRPVEYINVGEYPAISKYGDSIHITSQTNVPPRLIKMEVESGDWLKVSGEGGNYTVVAEPNPTGPRYASMKISAPNRFFGGNISWDSETINITQESGEPTYINPERNSISFDKYGKPTDKANLVISTDGVLESVASAPDWCNISLSPLSGERYQCVVTAGKNNGERKYGQISLRGGNITRNISVQQESGLASYIDLNISSLSVSSREETKYVDVKTDGTSWTIISKPSWLTVTRCLGEQKICVEFPSNSGSVKEGEIILASNNGHRATIRVQQDGEPTNFGASQSTVYFSKEEDYDYVTIYNNSKMSVSASADKGWIDYYITGDRIKISCPSNKQSGRRSGMITLECGSQTTTITVKQNGYIPCPNPYCQGGRVWNDFFGWAPCMVCGSRGGQESKW